MIGPNVLPRAVHPGAWWLWALGLAAAASRTSNPLLLVLVMCTAGYVVARRRTLLLEPGEMNDVRTVECVITLDGNTDGLLVGQRMRVRIGRGE